MPPDKLNEVNGGVRLSEELVVCKPVRVDDDVVRRVQVGDHIQRAGYSVILVWNVEDTDGVVFDNTQKLLKEGAVHVLNHVERDCCRVVSVLEGC